MPLVRIDLRAGKSTDYRRAIGDQVHRALVETIDIPPLDRFQVIAEHGAEGLIYDPTYLDIERTDDVIFIQIALSAGRTVEQKRALFARIAALLHPLGYVVAGLFACLPRDRTVSRVHRPRENK